MNIDTALLLDLLFIAGHFFVVGFLVAKLIYEKGEEENESINTNANI